MVPFWIQLFKIINLRVPYLLNGYILCTLFPPELVISQKEIFQSFKKKTVINF